MLTKVTPEKRKEYNKRYSEKHKQQIYEYDSKYRKEHIEQSRMKVRRWHQKHRYENMMYARNYRKTHTKNIICLNCGKSAQVTYNAKGKFCSIKCYNQWKVGSNCPNWKGGISYEPYCVKFNNDLRNRVRSFFENQCVFCGKTNTENGMNLCVHHVEYNKNACCDGKPVHFAALCRRCHNKTNHDRERWESILHRIIDEIYDGRSYYTKDEWKELNSIESEVSNHE